MKYLTIVLLIINLFNLTVAPLMPVLASEVMISNDITNSVFVEHERIDLRTQTAKVYQTGEYTYRLEESADKIHYKSGGSYKDINNNIIHAPSGKYQYRNAANDFVFRASSNLSGGVMYQGQKGFCEFKLDNISDVSLNDVPATLSGNKLIYKNIYDGADLEFSVQATGVTTEIVAKNSNALKDEIKFELTNCDQGVFQKAVMADNDSVSKVAEKVVIEDEKKVLVLNPDYSKLGDIKGEVRIDPSINLGVNVNVFTSQFMPSGHSRRFLAFGDFYDATNGAYAGISETYLKFDLGIPSGAYIQNATVTLRKYANAGSNFSAIMARLTQDINSNTGSSVNDWKSKGESYSTITVDSGDYDWDYLNWEIAPLVQKWIDGSATNLGVGIYSTNAGYRSGAAVCSTRIDGFCTSDKAPKLIVNYQVNQNPDTPNPVAPQTKSEYSGNCDESVISSTGICRSSLAVTPQAQVNDPDILPSLDMKESKFHFTNLSNQSASFVSSGIAGDGWSTISYNGNFVDGLYNWKVQSTDNQGATSLFSQVFEFVTDTTPPQVPVLGELPEFTKGVGLDDTVQIEVKSNKVADNIRSKEEIGYILQYSDTQDFSANVHQKPVQYFADVNKNPVFELGPKGLDQIYGTADDIKDGEKYYIRVKAQDKIMSNGDVNTSAWSNIVSTTIDATSPTLSNMSATEHRISPNNDTSEGIKDSTTISFNYTESNPQVASIEIYSDEEKTLLIKTLTQDVSAYKGLDNPAVSFVWDGKNDSGEFVADGVYAVYAKVVDQAGNISDNTQSIIIIVDNNEANITISSPMNNYWTNKDEISIKGQVKAPHDPGPDSIFGTKDDKLDQDLSSFQILNQLVAHWNDIETIDDFFEIIINPNYLGELQPGTNIYSLRTIDTVGNVKLVDWIINRENTPPIISNIAPAGLINNRINPITFRIFDPDPTGDQSEQSLIPINKNVNVYLTFSTIQDSNLVQQTKPLIQDGINLDRALIDDIKCVTADGATIDTKNNNYSSSILDCVINFVGELQPDTTYTINIQASDNAGNIAIASEAFVLDSHTYSTIISPVQQGIYSTSDILFSGTASKGSILLIKNTELGGTRIFTLNEFLDDTGIDLDANNQFIKSNFQVTCGKYLDIDNSPDTADEEVCDWQVRVAQKFVMQNIDTTNHNIVMVADVAGNVKAHEITSIVNLYNFDLVVDSNLEYFSPNGDGRQDSIIFSHSATNPTDAYNPPRIDRYKLSIQNIQGDTIRAFEGSGYLPAYTLFDGKWVPSGDVTNGNQMEWVQDGEYRYELEVTTTDNVTIKTSAKSIFAKTNIDNEVVITSPVSGFVTTSGVVTVQGQAEVASRVNLCVDTIVPNSLNCDTWAEVIADENGFFSTLMVLPRFGEYKKLNNIISATSTDKYGNQSPRSNLVEVVLDTIDPFDYVKITPTLTGITSDVDYERFLNGELNIDQIRAIVLEAGVTQNTNQVQLSFADYSNLIEKPENSQYNFIALINDQVENDPRLNPLQNPDIKMNHNLPIGDANINDTNCNDENGCSWKYQMPVNSGFAGIYEIEFKGKKGEIIQSMTAGFMVDASIPAAPVFMIVEKCMERSKNSNIALEEACLGNWQKIENVNMRNFVETGLIRFRGAAEPGSYLELTSFGVVLASTIVPETGIYEIYVDLDPFLKTPGNNSGQGNGLICREWKTGIGNERKCAEGDFEFGLRQWQYDENGNLINPIEGGSYILTYDEIAPNALSIIRMTEDKTIAGWAKTGDLANYFVTTDEKLAYVDLIKEDGFVRLFSKLYEGDNPPPDDQKEGYNQRWGGTINIDRLSRGGQEKEGYYNPIIRLVDLAGNKSEYDASLWEQYGLGDFRIYIDNTIPEITNINKVSWSTTWGQGGVNADGIYPELGRTNPEYVVKNDYVTITGRAEKNQRVELWVNNKFSNFIQVSDEACFKDKLTDNDKVIKDGLIVKYAQKCTYKYDYYFNDDGTNTSQGVPINGYTLQVRVIDSAANVSEFSKQEIIYHDTSSPQMPEIIDATSGSYSPIVDWRVNGQDGGAITKDMKVSFTNFAERFADMDYQMINPKGEVTTFATFVNDTTGKYTKEFDLGTQQTDDRDGCVKMIGNRRTGVCNDGIYAFNLQATDAAGNKSQKLENVRIERDTVRPERPEINVIADDVNHNISLSIKGEPGAIVRINDNNKVAISNDGNLILQVLSPSYWEYGTKYVWKVDLIDRAGNVGLASYANYTTPMPPVKSAFECRYIDGGKIAYPFEGMYKVTSPFGYRIDPFTKQTKFHNGIDFATPQNTEVLSAENGIVVYREDNATVGKYLIVHHQSLGISTIYVHLDKNIVKVGHTTTRGMLIAYSGNTGYSTGPHLHFTTRTGAPGTEFDPMMVLGNCQSEAGQVAGDIDKNSAVEKFEKFIADNINPESEIADDSFGSNFPNKRIKNINNIHEYLSDTVHEWCGVWVLDFGYIKERNGQTGYDGIAILNPYDGRVYLVKNAIWEKYRNAGGPCSQLGVPKDTAGNYSESKAGIRNDSKANSAWYQRFQNDKYFNNSIYWYSWSSGSAAYMVLNKVANTYESLGGTWSEYAFPTGDTYDLGCGGKQWFEFGKEIDMCSLPIVQDPIDRLIYLHEQRYSNVQRIGGIENRCGTKIQKYSSIITEYGVKNDESWIIYNPEDGKTYFMTGSILQKFMNLNGGWNCGGNNYPDVTGYPKSDEGKANASYAGTNGWYQHYAHKTKGWSSIYNSSKGTFFVTSNIRQKFENMGGTSNWNYLGFPTSDSRAVKSICGTEGYTQSFEGGRIFDSIFGTYSYKQNDFLIKYDDKGGVSGELGWPIQELQNNSLHTKYYAKFEGGTLVLNYWLPDSQLKSVNIGDASTCAYTNQRANDSKHGALDKVIQDIWAKENQLFEYFKRADGYNGEIHPYCGGWAVDYVDTKTKSGDNLGYSWIMHDGDNAYLVKWDIWQKYWDDGACSNYGLPQSEEINVTGMKILFTRLGAYKQNFEKGVVYRYDSILGWRTYGVRGNIFAQYKQNNESEGKYGLPKSDRYNFSYNGVDTQCQDFNGGRLCENTIPEKTDAQKAFETKYSKTYTINDIKVMCDKPTIDINEGLAFYDSNLKQVIEITGNVHHRWRYEGGCSKYGFPTLDTSYKKVDGNQGAYQRFYTKDNYFDIYHSYYYGWVELFGEYRNEFKWKGGIDKLGYPKPDVYIGKKECKDAAIAEYINVQNGRIYKVDNKFYLVYAGSSVGNYFFDNDGHAKFGVPKGDETGGLMKALSQEFEYATIEDPIGFWNGVKSDPELEGIFCAEDAPKCGNNKQEYLEVCDDGNEENDDQCSSDCRNSCEAPKFWDGKECKSPETAPVCGNSVIESGEQCDDGNTNNGDGCSASCTIEVPLTCGNEVIDVGEECDEKESDEAKHNVCTDTCQLRCKSSSSRLPWHGGESKTVTQDEHDVASYNIYAIDFGLGNGEGVVAIKGGVVKYKKETYVDGNPSSSAPYNSKVDGGCYNAYSNKHNYVIIDHEDGTGSYYIHLQNSSVPFEVGDRVERGEIIGKVGATGKTCGYHLHFTSIDISKATNANAIYSTKTLFSDKSVCNSIYQGVPTVYAKKYYTTDINDKNRYDPNYANKYQTSYLSENQ